MIYQLLGHYLEAAESAISLTAWIKKLRTLPLRKVQKSTEKLRFLQVAKGRVVQKYISILEENTAGWDIKEYQYLSLDLGEKHDQEYSKLVLHIYHIFSYAVPNAFIFLYVILNL